MMRRLAERPGLGFGLVFAWKVLLLILTAQPVPANDAFFYDGAVVNYLLHGKYVNPSLVQVLPISGNEVFSAYPPLYQLLLLGWMSAFGTSALAAMWLHVVLLGGYMRVVLGIFRLLNVSSPCASLAGLFLLSITFHDRPDTLAHLVGALAIYAAARHVTESLLLSRSAPKWSWRAAALLLLTLCTSLQIGAIYLLWAGLIAFTAAWLYRMRFPWAPMLTLTATVGGLIALVRFGFPLLWEGFQEHAEITPSFTGWRLPEINELLKLVRTAPGILLAGVIMAVFAARNRLNREELARSPRALMAMTGALSALALIGATLLIITANAVHIANYLQPIIVGCFLAFLVSGSGSEKFGRLHFALFLVAAGLVSVRAVGMTTWGVACSVDMGYRDSIQIVRQQLENTAPDSTVLLSSAYLYESAHRSDLRWIHADWPGRPAQTETTWEGEFLTRLKPAKLIITQFDYYRRYTSVLAHLQARPDLVDLKIHNTAKTPAPDSFKSFQRIVQHVAWAPVAVEFSWR
jgi:hypothetical protein